MFELFIKGAIGVGVVCGIAALTSGSGEAICPLVMGVLVIFVLYHTLKGLGG